MGFVEIVSLTILLLVGVVGVLLGVAALAGRLPAEMGQRAVISRVALAAVYLLGGGGALVVGVMWVVSL